MSLSIFLALIFQLQARVRRDEAGVTMCLFLLPAD